MIFLVESFSTMFWWKKAKRISKRGSVLKVRGSCYFCGFIKNSLPNFYFILQIHHGEKTLEFGKLRLSAGKSVTKALILESVNPQYDNRLFIDLQLLTQKNTNSEHFVYNSCFECQNKICVHNLFSSCSPHILSLEFSCTEVVIQ